MSVARYPSCILASCCIPWNAEAQFIEESFRRHIRNVLKNLTQDVYIFGTAGEGYAISDKMFEQIVRVLREETNEPGIRGMVGIISLSLATIIERIEKARDMGIRRFQISLPSWGALNDRELKVFFNETCGRFRDCQFLHYNLLRTKRLVTAREYAALANEHPNLVATKNSTDSIERIQTLLTDAPQLQHFFTETGFAYASQIKECGFLISVASIHFTAARQYFEAGRARNVDSLLLNQRQLTELVTELVSLGRGVAHMDGAYDKLFCRLHDSEFPLRLLPPYDSLDEMFFQQFRDLIREKYPHWSISQ